MNEFTSHKHGTFSWVDLGTKDLQAASKFYNELFGWQEEDATEGEGSYRFYTKNGKPVAGAYTLMEDQIEQGVPPYWMSYVSVDDAKEASEKATENGGQVIVEPREVGNEGTMALFQDPEGGLLGIWQAGEHCGSAYKWQHGSLCWNEYGSHDQSKPKPFYENVFGWKAVDSPMGDMPYTIYNIGEEMISGMYSLPEEMKDVPPHWLAYFEVDNIDKAIEIVNSNGGGIMMPKNSAPGVGQFAVVRDPQGAVFGVVQSEKKEA